MGTEFSSNDELRILQLRISQHISILPTEMLVEIFQHLTARERNNVKLVCRRWNAVCNIPMFANYSKLCFIDLHPLAKITNALANIHSIPRTMQFYKVDLKNSYSDFWKVCGTSLRNLELQSCEIDQATFIRIMDYCPKLTSLVWNTDISFFDSQMFSLLRQSNVVIRSLRHLVVEERSFSWDQVITVELLQSIFIVFPSIEKFTISFCIDITNKCAEVFNKIRTLSPEVTDKFEIRFPYSSTKLYFWCGDVEPMEKMFDSMRITEISMMNMRTTMCPSLQHIKKLNEKLETFHASISSWASASQVFLFVQDCKNLRHLRLTSKTDLYINMNMVKILLTMPLRSLFLSFSIYGMTQHCEYDSLPLPINRTLRTLKITYVHKYPKSFRHVHAIALLTRCRALSHLSLCNVTNEELDTVIEYQRRLETLELHFEKHCTTLPSLGSPFFTLQSLAHLIIIVEKLNPTLERFFAALNYPYIQYIRVALTWDFEEQEFPPDMITSIENLASLESINLSNEFTTYEKLLQFCCKLKKLRFLRICFSFEMTRDQINGIFCQCPSLRSLVYTWPTIKGNYVIANAKAYKYDIFEKKVLEMKYHSVINTLCKSYTCNHGWGSMAWDEDYIP